MSFSRTPEQDAAWNRVVNANASDEYSAACTAFAEAFAVACESRMKDGKAFAEVADEAMKEEAKAHEITGAQYGAAVGILVSTWEHGPALRAWHNKQWGGEAGEQATEQGEIIDPSVVAVEAKPEPAAGPPNPYAHLGVSDETVRQAMQDEQGTPTKGAAKRLEARIMELHEEKTQAAKGGDK